MLPAKFVFAAAMLFACCSVFSQDVPVSAGGTASGSQGSVSYSVGLVNYTAIMGGTGSASAGNQQAYTVSSVSFSENMPSYDISFFPNPTTDFINISIGGDVAAELSYELSDMGGKIISQKKMNAPLTSIPVSELSSAVYFLKIYHNNSAVAAFKISKI